MTCGEARQAFSAWVDEALATPEREEVAAHLAACPECARELDRFARTVGLLRAVERPRAPAGLADRVMEVVRRDPWHRRALRFALGPRPAQIPVSIGATAVIAALTVYLYQHVPELQRAAWREAPPAVERIEPLTPVPAEPTEPSPAPGSPPPPAAFRSSTPARRPGGAPAVAPVETSARDRVAAERPGGEPAAGAPAPPGPKAEREETAEQRAAPAKELADTTRSAAARPGALAAPEAPHVAGRLIVADRAAGLAALDRLAADLGATGLGRRPDSDATVVELAVPRSAYQRLEPGLRAIGAWEPEPAPAGLPHTVRVLVRVVPR